MKQPAFFIPHGAGPCFFMEWSYGPRETWFGLAAFLRELLATLDELPRSAIVISAHWEQPHFTVNGHHRSGLLYDYVGFPPHTYALRYSPPGVEGVASQIEFLAGRAGIKVCRDDERGLDHGVFVPMLLIDESARIPVIQLSLKQGLDPSEHMAIGRALASLRAEGVLVVASGSGFHNLQAFGSPDIGRAAAFDRWLTYALCEADPAQRDELLAGWESAPDARYSHPREEHLLPLMVAAGSAPGARAKRVFHEPIMGIPTSAFRFDD